MKRGRRQLLTVVAMLLGFSLLVAVSAAGFKSQTARTSVEQMKFKLLEKRNGYDLREYAPSIQARVLVTGSADFAMNEGFGPLAGYIFGRNTRRAPEGGEERIAMTTPVTMEENLPPLEKPDTPSQDNANPGHWVAFTMPGKYTLDTLPTPRDENVKLEARPAFAAAAISFSGWGGMGQMREYEDLLRACLKRDGIEVAGNPTYARYDPPWTLPLLRKNEVILPVILGTTTAPAAEPEVPKETGGP